MTTPTTGAAALATELAHLVNLPVEQRGDAEGARYDQVRWALADIDSADRMTAYAAAIAAIDPHHLLGPYPDPLATAMTHELYAFETWRVLRIFNGEERRSKVARRLLLVTDPLLHTYTPTEIAEYSYVQVLLAAAEITSAHFPHFSLRAYRSERGIDLPLWAAAAAAGARATASGDASTES